MYPVHILGATLFLIACAGITFEFFRFQDALNVATQEHASYFEALKDTACAKDVQVVSVEWKGSVLDCNLARLILQRSPRRSAYILWWNQSAWVALWQRVAHNSLILTIISVALVISFVGFGMHAVSSMHLHRQMSQTLDKFQKRQRILALPPPSAPVYFKQPQKRRVIEDISE
jgi:hypothetical protein